MKKWKYEDHKVNYDNKLRCKNCVIDTACSIRFNEFEQKIKFQQTVSKHMFGKNINFLKYFELALVYFHN